MSGTTIDIKKKTISSDVTEELASKLFHNKGTRVMAIVELVSDETGEKRTGDRKVQLLMESIELVVADGKTGDVAEDHIRTFQQALYRNRMLAQGAGDELPFGEEDGPAPKVADVLQQGTALVEKDENNNVTGLFSNPDSKNPPPA